MLISQICGLESDADSVWGYGIREAQTAQLSWDATKPESDEENEDAIMTMFLSFAPRPTQIIQMNAKLEVEDLDYTQEEVVEPKGLVQAKRRSCQLRPWKMRNLEVLVDKNSSVMVSPAECLAKLTKMMGERYVKRNRKEPWKLPALSLLNVVPGQHASIDSLELREKAKLLEEKLLSFKVRGKVVGIRPGPVVTIFEFAPDPA